MHVVECMRYAHIKHTIYSACTVMHALWDQIMQISKYASKPHYGNQDYDCACYIHHLLPAVMGKLFIHKIFLSHVNDYIKNNIEPMTRFIACSYGQKCHALTMGWANFFLAKIFGCMVLSNL